MNLKLIKDVSYLKGLNMPKPFLSIIIVSTNEYHLAKPSIESIYNNNKGVNFEIILVDNCSSDETHTLPQIFKDIIYIKNSVKYGYAQNNNIGINASRGDYLLLLDPDTIVLEDCLANMVEFMEHNEDVGLSGCKLLNVDKTLQHSCRRYPSPLVVIYRALGKHLTEPHPRFYLDYINYDGDYDSVQYPEWLLGAFMFIRRKAMDQVGVMDPKYFLYYEDIDYALQMWKKNWKVAYNPNASIIHIYNDKRPPKRWKIHAKSISRFYLKNMFFLMSRKTRNGQK